MKLFAVMPTFDQHEFILAAVESVLPQVEHLVIVNDASTDDTAGFIDFLAETEPNVSAGHLQENSGTAAEPINVGFRWLAQNGKLADNHQRYPATSWVSWVSSDNVMHPRWREAMFEAVEGRAGIGAVYGGFDFKRPGQPASYLFEPYDAKKQIGQEECYFGPAFMIRSDVWLRAGGHEGGSSHDLGHWLRVEEVCWQKGLRIVGVDESLCTYNAHPKRCAILDPSKYDAPAQLEKARTRRERAECAAEARARSVRFFESRGR